MPISGAAAAAGMTSAEDASVTRHRRRHLRRFSNHPRERRRTHHHPSQLSTGDAVDTRSQQQQQQHHSGDDGARRHRRPTQLRQPSSPHLSQSYASGNMQINATSLTSGPATSTTTPTPANAAAAGGGGGGAPNTARAPSRPRDGHRSFRRSIYTSTPPRQRPTSTHAPANITNNTNNNANNNNNNNSNSSGNTTSSTAHPPALPSTLRFRREDGGGYVLSSDAHGATAMGTAIMRSTQQLPLSASLLEVALPRLPPTSWMDEDDDECTNEVGEDGGAMIQTPTNVFTQRSRGSGRPSAATSRSPLAANKSQSHNAIVGLNTRIQEQEELVMYLSSSAVTVPSSPTSPRRLLSPTSVLHVLPSSPQPQLHQRPLSPMPNVDGVGGDVLTAATNTSGAAYNLALATVSSLRSGSSEESLTDDDDSSSERSADDGVEEMGSSSILSALEEGGGIIFSDSYLRLHPESALTTRCHRLSAHTASLHNSPRPLRSEGRSLSPHPANFRSGRSRLTSPTIATTADNVAPTRWEAGSSAEPSSPSTHFLAYPSSPSTPQYQQQQQQLFASPRGVGSGAATITLGRSVAAAGRSSSRFTSQISAPFSPTDPNSNNNNNSFSTILPMMMDAVVLEVYDSTINNANGGRRRHRDRRRLPSRPVPTPQHTSPRPSMAGGVQADLKHAAEYLVDVAQNQRPMFRRKTSAEAYGRGTYFQPVDVNVPRSLMQDPLKQTRRPSDPLAGMGTMRDDGEGMLSDTSGTCMSIASPSRTLGPPPQMQPANFDSSIMHGSEWINQ